MLNPVHLRTLVTVLRTGSFAHAARELGYTGSAVSQQITMLERAVKVPLFDRAAHSVQPTAAAEFLASRAHDALASLQALDDDITGLTQGAVGRLRIGSFPTASESLLPEALAKFLLARPDMEVMLDEGEADELVGILQDGAMDLGLVYHYDLVPRSWPRTLQSRALLDEELILLLPERHRLVGERDLQLADLAAEAWVSTKAFTSGAKCLARLCNIQGFEPAIAFRSNDYDVVRSFVRAGLGVALVPALSHQDAEGVVAGRVTDVSARRHVSVLHRITEHNRAVIGAVNALERAASGLIGSRYGVELPTHGHTGSFA